MLYCLNIELNKWLLMLLDNSKEANGGGGSWGVRPAVRNADKCITNTDLYDSIEPCLIQGNVYIEVISGRDLCVSRPYLEVHLEHHRRRSGVAQRVDTTSINNSGKHNEHCLISKDSASESSIKSFRKRMKNKLLSKFAKDNIHTSKDTSIEYTKQERPPQIDEARPSSDNDAFLELEDEIDLLESQLVNEHQGLGMQWNFPETDSTLPWEVGFPKIIISDLHDPPSSPQSGNVEFLQPSISKDNVTQTGSLEQKVLSSRSREFIWEPETAHWNLKFLDITSDVHILLCESKDPNFNKPVKPAGRIIIPLKSLLIDDWDPQNEGVKTFCYEVYPLSSKKEEQWGLKESTDTYHCRRYLSSIGNHPGTGMNRPPKSMGFIYLKIGLSLHRNLFLSLLTGVRWWTIDPTSRRKNMDGSDDCSLLSVDWTEKPIRRNQPEFFYVPVDFRQSPTLLTTLRGAYWVAVLIIARLRRLKRHLVLFNMVIESRMNALIYSVTTFICLCFPHWTWPVSFFVGVLVNGFLVDGLQFEENCDLGLIPDLGYISSRPSPNENREIGSIAKVLMARVQDTFKKNQDVVMESLSDSERQIDGNLMNESTISENFPDNLSDLVRNDQRRESSSDSNLKKDSSGAHISSHTSQSTLYYSAWDYSYKSEKAKTALIPRISEIMATVVLQVTRVIELLERLFIVYSWRDAIITRFAVLVSIPLLLVLCALIRVLQPYIFIWLIINLPFMVYHGKRWAREMAAKKLNSGVQPDSRNDYSTIPHDGARKHNDPKSESEYRVPTDKPPVLSEKQLRSAWSFVLHCYRTILNRLRMYYTLFPTDTDLAHIFICSKQNTGRVD